MKNILILILTLTMFSCELQYSDATKGFVVESSETQGDHCKYLIKAVDKRKAYKEDSFTYFSAPCNKYKAGDTLFLTPKN